MAAASSKGRENSVYLSRLAERSDEMAEGMKKVAELDVELTVEERNLFSVGDRNMIGQRRASWSILPSIEQTEGSRGNVQNLKRIKEHRCKVEAELANICGDVMRVDEHLIPSCAAHRTVEGLDEAIPSFNS